MGAPFIVRSFFGGAPDSLTLMRLARKRELHAETEVGCGGRV